MSPCVHTVPLHICNMLFKNAFRLCKSYPSFSYLLALKAPAGMENSERRHSASGKKIKCITERLHNKPQQGTQAPTDSGRRKFCVYSVTASCLRLPTTQLFMETHIWEKVRAGEVRWKSNVCVRRVLKNDNLSRVSVEEAEAAAGHRSAQAVRHFCFDPEPLQSACWNL